MSHYYTELNDTLKSNPKEIAFRVNGTPLKFITDSGVFAKDGFDRGTEVLLSFLDIPEGSKRVLDLGCGYGVVGVYVKKTNQDLIVDMVDINERAIDLSKKNVALNKVEATVFKSNGFSDVKEQYDLIISNPPIRAGKKVYYQFFEDAYSHLTDDGALAVVINKKHGASSTEKYLKTIYHSVELVGRKKGFQVFICKK